MLTYVQDFNPYQVRTVPKTDRPEGKAAARRRRQMERQQRRAPSPDALLPPASIVAPAASFNPELEIQAIEDMQADREASQVALLFEPLMPLISRRGRPRTKPPAAPAAVTQAKLVEWFQKWRKPIRSWLRNRASVPPGDIDDLAQEVFLRLLRYSHDVLVDNPQGYLFRIAANVANEWRERSRIKKPHDPTWLDEIVMDEEYQPEKLLEREQLNETVEEAFFRLKPRQQLVLREHTSGLTYGQIAEKHGLTYRIVLRELTRAYSTLRMELPHESA
jgi:RNA polymerase sigma factor (sigma-70 family)